MAKKTVNDMKIGERAVVTGLGCSGALRRRIIDMGITPGAVVILRKAALWATVGDQRAGV